MIGATYRLQFREGVGFDEAAALVPHLTNIGVTHLYASPIFAAHSGSTHGYDVTDHNRLDDSLGGEEAFARLSLALKQHGLGLLLDIVPNHMAASTENPWWRDVLQHGRNSPFAHHFDIDWSAKKLVLPILGQPYGEVLKAGEIRRARHPDWGEVLEAPGHTLPLAPGTEEIADPHECHEAQHYRLAHWRIGRDGLTYRRFFEITGLVGVRVEEDGVFDDVHALIERLVRDGDVHALRVDHVDGLADPAAYLEKLSGRVDVPIFVEKILEAGETLPDWSVAGTTGYEFIASMAALCVDPDGIGVLSHAYGEIADDDAGALGADAKKRIVEHNVASELSRLTGIAVELFGSDLVRRDYGPDTVREGLSALLCAMPVYRTYATGSGVDARDASVLGAAVDTARSEPRDEPEIIEHLAALLVEPATGALGHEFVARFQQLSGPLMAKAIEDTLYYRHHRFLGMNEVGGGPHHGFGTEPLIKAAQAGGLAATSTHDTKRGEDARTRLYALSDPDAAQIFSGLWRELPGDIPDRLKWALGQMLFASSPLEPDPTFVERFRETAIKTVREAKEETSWTATNPAFEERIVGAAEAMAAMPDPFEPLNDARRAGAILSLTQSLLKTFGRAAPDIYQGGLGWDFSMVDPDNRRPVDFAGEARLVERARSQSAELLCRDWRDGAVKAAVVLAGLAARAERPGLFAGGAFEEVPLDGDAQGYRAFRRSDATDEALAIVPIRPGRLLGARGLSTTPPELGFFAERPLVNRLTGAQIDPSATGISRQIYEFPLLFATSWAASNR